MTARDPGCCRAWTRWAQAVSRRRWLAAGAGMAVIIALAFSATDLQVGSSDADTMAKSGDAKQGLVARERAGIGEGSLLPHDILVTNPQPPSEKGQTPSAPQKKVRPLPQLLIVPAVISLMGRWNRWLPRWPARLLRVEPSPPRRAALEGRR
jgi:uncharacterized membrane protein YdfJ with MMPL/SSD domain